MMESRVLDVLDDRVLALGPKPDAPSPYRNFKLTRDADGIAWLLFDREGASANTLSADVMEEFDKILGELESQRPAGLVIRSAKKSGFIAGADVNEFRGASDPQAVETAISRAHAVIDRLLARHRVKRNVALRVPGLHVLPMIVANSDLLAVVPRRLADAFAARVPIRVLPLPVALPQFDICIHWHERYHNDPAIRWMRRAFVDLFSAQRRNLA